MPSLQSHQQTFTNFDDLLPSSKTLDCDFYQIIGNSNVKNYWEEQKKYLSSVNTSKFILLPEVSEVVNFYDPNSVMTLYSSKYQTLGFSSSVKIDTSKTVALLWYSFLNNEICNNVFGIKRPQPSIKEEITKRYSMIKEVQGIYVFEIDNDLCIDVLSSLDYITNRDLEKLIDTELEIREVFQGISISFSYYSKEGYIPQESSVKLY